MPTDALMDITTEHNKDEPCVCGKAQRQGAEHCRNVREHCHLQYPGISFSQSNCKALKDFRGSVFDIKDQMYLQRAQLDGGADGVTEALELLWADPLSAAIGLTGPDPEAPLERMFEGFEWCLGPWLEDNDKCYVLKTSVYTTDFANMLRDADDPLVDKVADVIMKSTHLSGTNSALTSTPGAPNQQSAVCPSLIQWLMSASRIGKWECADAAKRLGQHECKVGRERDQAICYPLHPAEEYRWVVLGNRSSRWMEAMPMDECLHYSGEGKLLAFTKDSDFTHADVWGASIKAVAYGRTEIVAQASEPEDTPTTVEPPEETAYGLCDSKHMPLARRKCVLRRWSKSLGYLQGRLEATRGQCKEDIRCDK